ncbi:phosphotransferase family protein [Lederbergia citrea]
MTFGGDDMAPIERQEIPADFLKITGEIKYITFPEQGCTSNVGIIESENGRFVLKRAFEKRYCKWLEKEAQILKGLQDSKLPVPNIYAFTKEPDQAWILMEYLPGTTMGKALQKEPDPEKRKSLIFQFGKVLATIHSTPCPADLQKANWLDEMLERAEHDLHEFEVDGTPELLKNLKKNKPEGIEQTLIHGDFTEDNVLVHEGEISGIIDWSGGAFGDPRFDVALAIWPKEGDFENKQVIDLFFEGYGKKILNDAEYDYFANGLYDFF